MNEAVSVPQPAWRRIFGFALDPGGLIRGQLAQVPLAEAFAVPAMAFALFFLQTGLDRARVGKADGVTVALLTLAGLLFGTLGIGLVALLGWGAVRALGGTAAIGEVQRAFALAYSPALISTLLGLGVSLLLGSRTALVFGVTGVLWALGPMSGAVRQMLGGRQWGAIAVSTLCGLAVLLGWARLEALL